ncbi:MAG: NRDE family protein [Candidatus Sumerlaeia bacterium]|nr:NRDE family protein [Candidatus Sumerlaeia bacterium]
MTLECEPAAFTITMNRDEARNREPEHPPEWHRSSSGVAWVAPSDGRTGGTWIGVNEHGAALCLLNGYRVADAQAGHMSRGAIIPDLLSLGPAEEIMKDLRERYDPRPYASFRLVVAAGRSVHEFEWDGVGAWGGTEHSGHWVLLSSSSVEPEATLAYRRRLFVEWLENGCVREGTLPAFHRMSSAGHESESPLMSRPKSATRSITQARVDFTGGEARMCYWPRPHDPARHEPRRLALPLLGRGRA